jgi:L-fuconolactonase
MIITESIIEPDLPIIDPHHHLWDRSPVLHLIQQREHPFQRVLDVAARYLLNEYLADLNRGHNVIASVFIECNAMLRANGPAEMKPVGETEFVNGVAAMSASGIYGPQRVCAGIVGHVDLTLGTKSGEVLDAQIRAGGGRFGGIRHSASWDSDPAVLGPLARRPEGIYRDPKFREGFAQLAPRNLSFDAWLLEPQLPDLIDLARAFQESRIVLDHVGTPLGIASYQGKREERFAIWSENIRTLAKCPNVFVKLGGLAMVFCNFPSCLSAQAAPTTQLATEWRPYIETCIAAFGSKRAMFESNFPVDSVSCSYDRLWNAFKLIVKGASPEEKADLFFGTANRFYRLGLGARSGNF